MRTDSSQRPHPTGTDTANRDTKQRRAHVKRTGDDTVNGGGGNDALAGGLGDDTITCGAGTDTAYVDGGDTVSDDCERRVPTTP
jgi:Ca2+-binding RTX toxin-like protein